MGSIAASLVTKSLPPPDLVAAIQVNPGRSGANARTLQLGAWMVAAAGADAWITRNGSFAAVVTGMLDDLEPEVDPAAVAIGAVAGDGSPAPMRGVFSAIVTDGERLWAWRDQLGFSPLFAAGTPTSAVATSARQALAAAGLGTAPDVEMIRKVFWGVPIAEEDSYFLGARRVPKATLLVTDGNRVQSDRYWTPDGILESRALQSDPRDEFIHLMSRAVRRALGQDPVVALSGGVDAPAVAGFASPIFRQLTGRRLPALSSVYPRWPSVDESNYIEIVARHNQMELHTFEPVASPLEGIGGLLQIAEAPAPTVSLAESAEYYELAAKMGYRTILTGEMAEFVMAMSSHTLRHLLRAGRWGKATGYLLAERARGLGRRRVFRLLATAAVPDDWLRERRRRRQQLPQQGVSWLSHGADETRTASPGNPWITSQLSAFQGPGLSVEADEAIQMNFGVRVRRPWLDVDLWEFFLSLPAEVKYPNGQYKALARRWLRGYVPDEILDRRDRTYFEESFFGRLDYSALKSHIFNGVFEMPGVDYAKVRERLDEASMSLIEAMWAKDLAVIHAFMDQYR